MHVESHDVSAAWHTELNTEKMSISFSHRSLVQGVRERKKEKK